MKNLIRLRFTAIFAVIIAMILFMTWALNTFGLIAYYTTERSANMGQIFSELDEIIADGGDTSDTVTQYSDRYNMSILVYDTVENRVIASSQRDGEYLFKRLWDRLFTNEDSSEDLTVIKETNQYRIVVNKDEKGKRNGYIEFFGYCSDNKTMVLMSSPIEALKAAAGISNKFLFLTGMTAAMLGCMCIFAMADRIDNRFSQLERDLNKKIEQEKIQQDFIANVSHELKTPIAIIQGYAEGLSDGLCKDDESRKEYADVIVDEAEKMNSLVRQLLTISSLESGNVKLDIEDMDLMQLVRDVVTSSSILAQQKNASVILDAPDEVMVQGDPERLESVFTNLFSNACHHVDEGGTITVKVCDASKNRIKLSVINTGSHIPKEDLERVFDRFYKVDKSHSRSYGGTGIGLSIVKAVMKAHDMPYGVNNTDSGVDFWLELKRSV